MSNKKYITIRMTREEALQQGLLICTCGHPPNNHFESGKRSCAHCDCKEYTEISRIGEIVNSNNEK